MKRHSIACAVFCGIFFFGGWAGVVCAIEDEDCLGCHQYADEVGADLSIDTVRYSQTAHAGEGCLACHQSVSDDHPDGGSAALSIECANCHEEVASVYAQSVHGGNAECTDCHNPHAVASTESVSGETMNGQCAACHDLEAMTVSHDRWLPQARLHIGMLPCVSCHSGSDDYVIAMYIIEREAAALSGTYKLVPLEKLNELSHGNSVESLVDKDSDRFISLDELKAFNRHPEYGHIQLKAMFTPLAVSHNFMTLDDRWDCTFCHTSGPDIMHTSYVAFPRENGTYVRLPVEKGAIIDVLNSAPDFYMMGASRDFRLNIIGAIIVLGGLIMPVGHGTMRFLTRKNRRKGH